MLAHTSVEAYHSLREAGDLAPMELRVMQVFTRSNPGAAYSRQQIAQISGMPINCVCGRVHSLVEAGILEEHGEHLDPVTRKHQKLLRVVGEVV